MIEDLFPITYKVRDGIIGTSDLRNTYNCIGANSLKEALQSRNIKYQKVSWCNTDGYFIADNKMYSIKSNIEMLWITQETEVIFSLYQ